MRNRKTDIQTDRQRDDGTKQTEIHKVKTYWHPIVVVKFVFYKVLTA